MGKGRLSALNPFQHIFQPHLGLLKLVDRNYGSDVACFRRQVREHSYSRFGAAAVRGWDLEPWLARLVNSMSITVQLDLPEDVAEKARAAGLLDCRRLSAILEEAVERDRQAKEFIAILDQIRAQSGEPMSMEEIQAEVDAVRAAARNGREAGT